MTPAQQEAIRRLRQKGYGYKAISKQLSLSVNTVKSFCRREGLVSGDKARSYHSYCQSCGQILVQTEGKRQKKFCGAICRQKWWNQNLHQVKRKAYTTHHCLCCHQSFLSYGNKKRRYCSHPCYITARFGRRES